MRRRGRRRGGDSRKDMGVQAPWRNRRWLDAKGADRRAHCVHGCLPATAVTFHLAATILPSDSGGYLKKERGLHLAGCPVNFRIQRSGAPAVRGVIRYVMHGPLVRFPCLSPPWSDCHLPVGARIVSSLGGWQLVQGVKHTIPCVSG